jgi:hypothetical protein
VFGCAADGTRAALNCHPTVVVCIRLLGCVPQG